MRAFALGIATCLFLTACTMGVSPGVTGQQSSVTLSSPSYPEVRDLDASGIRPSATTAGSNQAIRYRLDRPALVRLRLVDKATPGIVLSTLLDWAPRGVGAQIETWDGRDRKGEQADPYKVSVAIVAEPVRDILAESDRQTLSGLRHPEHKHFLHPVDLCGDLNVKITSPTSKGQLAGEVNIEAELVGKLGMPDPEYHVVVYIDGRNAWDGRVTQPRLSVPVETRNIPDGEHLVAVTFNDLHDHAGSDWVKMVINNR